MYQKRAKIQYDQIILQTMVPKFMGELANWPELVGQAAFLGYNTIHFCPFQKRGASNSPYSINDQLELSDDLFTESQWTSLSSTEKWNRFDDTMATLRELYPEMRFISDIVWNHTSFDSDWIRNHPECTFSADRYPHLKPAVLVDVAIQKFCKNLQNPFEIKFSGDIHELLTSFECEELAQWKLLEFWSFDIFETTRALKNPNNLNNSSHREMLQNFETLENSQEKCKFLYDKFISGSLNNPWIRMQLPPDLVAFLAKSIKEGDNFLNVFSEYLRNVFNQKMEKMKNNLFNRIYYERLDSSGPLLGPITSDSIFSPPYFTFFPKQFLKENNLNPLSFCADNRSDFDIFENWHYMANNGWIWNADPLVNFALPPSDAYFIRDIIIWGDCVKLNYLEENHLDLSLETMSKTSDMRKDDHFIFKKMKDYTESLASRFDGLRLDNCHSTPIQAAKYFIQIARRQNDQLFIFAELFTGSSDLDIFFIKQLGLDCLLRESLACNHKEALVGNLFSIGEKFPIGSIRNDRLLLPGLSEPSLSKDGLTNNKRVILMDCTHDNKMPAEIGRPIGFYLANAAATAMACSSIGSSKGYDTCVPAQLDFISSMYKYPLDKSEFQGLEYFKRYIHSFRLKLLSNGFNELYIESHPDSNLIKITRENPRTLESYVMVIHMNFGERDTPLLLLEDKKEYRKANNLGSPTARKRRWSRSSSNYASYQEELLLGNVDVTIISSFRMAVDTGEPTLEYCHDSLGLHDFIRIDMSKFYRESNFSCITCGKSNDNTYTITSEIQNGSHALLQDCSHASLSQEFICLQSPQSLSSDNPYDQDDFSFLDSLNIPTTKTLYENEVKIKFSPIGFSNGSVFIFKKKPIERIIRGLEKLDQFLFSAWPPLAFLDHVDLNVLLFRTLEEDKDISVELQGYTFPGATEQLIYQGLIGIFHYFNAQLMDVDASAIAENIRRGNWFIEYFIGRIRIYGRRMSPRLCNLADYLEREWVDHYKNTIPTYLKPRYLVSFFSVFLRQLLSGLLNNPDLKISLNSLALNSVSLLGYSNSAPLFPLPLPTLYSSIVHFFESIHDLMNDTGKSLISSTLQYFKGRSGGDMRKMPSLSAGLKFFATDHMRVWGRDVFISFKGFFCFTNFSSSNSHRSLNLIADGLCHILAFASTAKHRYLIANLLDSGRFPRFNCRDSTWFFVKACQDFCHFLSQYTLLNDRCSSLLEHFLAITIPMRFPDHDSFIYYEDPKAYSVSITMKDLLVGIFEGHLRGIEFKEWNAGPNLDHAMNEEGFHISLRVDINYDDKKATGTGFIFGGNRWNAGTWMDKMGDSMTARNSGLPATPRQGAAIEIIALLFHGLEWMSYLSDRKLLDSSICGGITWQRWLNLIHNVFDQAFFNGSFYRDVVSNDYQELQIRPNFFIALALCPALFDSAHVLKAFKVHEEELLGPVGIRTLSKNDPLYRPIYNLEDNSDDQYTAHGWNYHNGPEWLWLRGYYYLSMMNLADNPAYDKKKILVHLNSFLESLKQVQVLGGLPELTNAEGQYCPFSCFNQAWSTATLLEAIRAISNM